MPLEQRGHAEFSFFDREVRQGRRDKTFHYTARTEANDIPQGKSRVDWKRRSNSGPQQVKPPPAKSGALGLKKDQSQRVLPTKADINNALVNHWERTNCRDRVLTACIQVSP
jgi:hypothetical protein